MALRKNFVFYSTIISSLYIHAMLTASISEEPKSAVESSLNSTNIDSEEAACIYGKIAYRHGSPVNSTDFCQPCICFHGNIMCRVIKCPGKPSPDCVVAELHNSCCPIFECPKVKLLPSKSPMVEGQEQGSNNTKEEYSLVKECEAAGGHFKVDEKISSLSGPCLECRCMSTGFIRCFPLPCKEEERQPLFYHKELFL